MRRLSHYLSVSELILTRRGLVVIIYSRSLNFLVRKLYNVTLKI